MQVGKPLHEYVVEPLELPEPLRTAPSVEPEHAPEQPEKVTEPEEEPVEDVAE